MKPDRLVKILLVGFVSALVLYVLSFSFIQYRRTFRGPWHVVFLSDNNGTAGLLVTQSKLKISERIVFSGQKLSQSNVVHEFVFDDPTKSKVPFGEIVFQDLTFLPGTVTLHLFGHEVELLPRVLIIDKQEYAWKTGAVVSVTGPGKFQSVKEK
jgi:hypothetical protein